jgi:S-adenosylmethionine:tRNA ribosyltransferase-isomerase
MSQPSTEPEQDLASDSSDPFQITDYYDYDLPKALIAQQPLPSREDARLMVVNRRNESIEHSYVRNLDELLEPGDCLVLNDSRVIPAKLVGYRATTGGRWQGLFLQADHVGNWKVLCKTRGHAKPGEKIILQDRQGRDGLELTLVVRMEDGSWIVRPRSEEGFEEILKNVGRVPLPNYIRKGQMVDDDLKNYQTIYAKHPGSVAAPTAGLHMTKALVHRLIDAGINVANVTLHVGIGTFKPVSSELLTQHEMHYERGTIEQKSVDKILATLAAGKRVIAVGTTSVRVVETASQQGSLEKWSGETNLFIRPPYQFKTVNAMLTNFHLPRSTLLVLVRTFGGDELMKRAYQEAIGEQYRFYSYGDAMLILD